MSSVSVGRRAPFLIRRSPAHALGYSTVGETNVQGGEAVSTGLIVAIVVVALIVIALLFLLPRLRAKKAEREHQKMVERRRTEAVEHHRSEADHRHEQAERRAAQAELAEQEAQRARAEAEIHAKRAELHERGMADDELLDDDDGRRGDQGRFERGPDGDVTHHEPAEHGRDGRFEREPADGSAAVGGGDDRARESRGDYERGYHDAQADPERRR
jgi:type IV secretory pathway VirB10-like protein